MWSRDFELRFDGAHGVQRVTGGWDEIARRLQGNGYGVIPTVVRFTETHLFLVTFEANDGDPRLRRVPPAQNQPNIGENVFVASCEVFWSDDLLRAPNGTNNSARELTIGAHSGIIVRAV